MVEQIENELSQFNSSEFYQEQIERTVEWSKIKGRTFNQNL